MATGRIHCLGGRKIYAIVETGGKQYRVTPGQVIDVDRLDVADGGSVELDKVLLFSGDGKVTVGTPIVSGARVIATVQGTLKAKKIIVFKYKNKVRYHKKTGHRQPYTKLLINEIIEPKAVPA